MSTEFQGAYIFNPYTRSYISAQGPPIDTNTTRKIVAAVRENTTKNLNKLAKELQSGELTNTAEFAIEFRDEIKFLFTTTHILAKGGVDEMSQSDWGQLGAALKDQYQYIGNLVRDVENGLIGSRDEDGNVIIRDSGIPELEDSFLDRVGMYTDSAWGAQGEFENVVRERESDLGSQERRVLGDAQHCPDCIEQADLGWQDPGILLDIGDTPCGPGCACTMEFQNEELDQLNQAFGIQIEDQLDTEKSFLKGGQGSGNFGHSGREGERGGSGGGGLSREQAGAERVAQLRIPPAWTNVQINPDTKASLQAKGTDSKGRTQYIYSAQHSEKMAAEKFDRLRAFNQKLPGLREQIAKDLKDPNLSPKEKESAAVLALIDKTGFRVGSDRDTRAEKQAYGVTTLQAEHVRITGDKVEFNFVGKKGVDISKTLEDKGLAQMLSPRVASGGRLFDTTDKDVRNYLHARDGDFKVKDFRTYNGTNTALREISSRPVPSNEKEFKTAQSEVAKVVAEHLGNTPKIAMQSYIDPQVWSRWNSKSWKSFSDDRMDEFIDSIHWVGDFDSWEQHVAETEESEDEPEY